MSRELPNMTATEIANAKQPPLPGQALLEWMIERELQMIAQAIPAFDQALDETTHKLRD
jgi:hypothetical protein